MSFRKLNWSEPAVLRGVVTALVALAASLGVVVTDEVKGAAEGLIPVFSFLLPLLQSLWTRQAVYSPETVAELSGRHTAPDA